MGLSQPWGSFRISVEFLWHHWHPSAQLTFSCEHFCGFTPKMIQIGLSEWANFLWSKGEKARRTICFTIKTKIIIRMEQRKFAIERSQLRFWVYTSQTACGKIVIMATINTGAMKMWDPDACAHSENKKCKAWATSPLIS